MKTSKRLLAFMLLICLITMSALGLAENSADAPKTDDIVTDSPAATDAAQEQEPTEGAPIAPPLAPKHEKGKMNAVVINENGTSLYSAMDATGTEKKSLDYGAEVVVSQLGLGWCLIKEKNEKLYVRTSDIAFSGLTYDNQIAIVHLKNSSQLPLHKEASAKSKSLKKIPNGTYVVVLEKGTDFSLVVVGGKEGYLQNDYLSFREAWQGEVTYGVLQDPDKPTRKTTVNMRSANAENGKKIKALKTGTAITVLNISGDWAEIELNGMHGYVMSKFVHIPDGSETT